MKKINGTLIALAAAATVVLAPVVSVNASAFSSSSSSDGGMEVPAKPSTPTTTVKPPVSTTPTTTVKPPVSTTPTTPVEEPSVEPLPFNASGLLGGTAQPNLPEGEPGEVSVVQIGPLDKTWGMTKLAFAFRNNTNESISQISWAATARSGGQIVATGSSQWMTPVHVHPGEVGLAYIYFHNGESIPDDAAYEFTVSTSPVGTGFRKYVQLTVTETNVSGNAIVGAAINQTGAQASGPYIVGVYCFDGDNLLSEMGGVADPSGDVADGGVVTFTVDTFGTVCPSYAVGISGYGR